MLAWAKLFNEYLHNDDSFYAANFEKGEQVSIMRALPHEKAVTISNYIEILDHKIANLYKQHWKLTKLGLMPALFVINMAGKIVFSYYSKSMKDILANDLIIRFLDIET